MSIPLSPQVRMAVAQALAVTVVGMLAKGLGPQMRRNVIVASVTTVLLYNVLQPKLAAEFYQRGI